jgi:hypothetical protein
VTRITSDNPHRKHNHRVRIPECAMPVLIQTAAEVLKVSAIPLVVASLVLIAFELVLIG